jgi:hypothetical protein
MTNDWIIPDWPAPPRVRALITTRTGGVSRGPYASLNLGDHVGDDPRAVAENRRLLRRHLPAEPRWLAQVHGTRVVRAESVAGPEQADAAYTSAPDTVCAVMTADCLPVLLCDADGTEVAIAHAGWRGLAQGVVERTVAAMARRPEHLLAYLGPAIGPAAFEVGDEVRAAFLARGAAAGSAFRPHGAGKWLADIYELARQRLRGAGVERVSGGDYCTVADGARFFSYRRDKVTGRMASLVWLARA